MGSAIRYHAKVAGDPYADLLARFIGQEFPQLASTAVEDVMEAVVLAFLTTKAYRVGPLPSPESLVMIRDVVRRAVDVQRPVPILIPWASVKVPLGESLDVAELSALKVLGCLQQRVREHYPPGVNIRIRLEDNTERAISEDPHLEDHISTYQGGLQQLVMTLGYGEFITLVPESYYVGPQAFLNTVDQLAPLFWDFLTQGRWNPLLTQAGWQGQVSPLLRQFLLDRYAKLYPGENLQEHLGRLARYLATILARKSHGAVGEDKTFKGRLEISFAPPLPDAPRVSTRVQYRTAPRSHTSLAIAPWNAKGYLELDDHDQPRIKLGPWDGLYHLGQLELSRDGFSTTIRADYAFQEDA